LYVAHSSYKASNPQREVADVMTMATIGSKYRRLTWIGSNI